jgi:two-component system, chemotaxis family, protein-glutamate methylesterase/glutaminase
MIRILIVDDSRVVQDFLGHLLSSDSEIQIVGFASSGPEAIDMVKLRKPDLITMDVHMPLMDGYEATRTIMETIPTPIVIVSGGANSNDVDKTYKALEAGALAVVLRPPGFEHPQFSTLRNELIQTIKLMSEVKVVKLSPKSRKDHVKPLPSLKTFDYDLKHIQIIAIGASTGGPMVLQKILSHLPADLPVPVLVVQHIAAGFVNGFKEWLSITSGIKLKIAEDGELMLPSTGYIAPDSFHLGVNNHGNISLSNLPPENGLRPSVNYLFRSVSEAYGPHALGVLLTGMGKDGAEELKTMKTKGGITIVQNEESSVVFGMPGEALRIGAADNAFPTERIAEILATAGSKR